jgi:acetyl-CoA C-acetyltransferase
MTTSYLFDTPRTPRGRGKASGALSGVTPIQLARTALAAVISRNDLDPAEIEDVILGCVEPVSEQGGNIARIAALYAGYGDSVPGLQVNRFCASGLEAVNLGVARVSSGQADAIVAGGVESMSRVPMGTSGGPWATDPQVATATRFIPQGISADLVATMYGFDREACDAYAVESQRRAAVAWEQGHFTRSVVPVTDPNGVVLLDRDEHLRPDTTAEGLARLRPSFTQLGANYGFDAVAMQRYPTLERIEHVHHAGNSSGIVDGAAAVLIGSAAFGERNGLTPRARVVSCATVGTEPTIMLTGPAPAARRALDRAGMQTGDIDLFEVNEAFAAVVLHFMAEMAVSHDRVNVNGGAIALGHPLGATGAMLLGTALDELERRDQGTALITLCVGAGMGTATISERVTS